MAVNEQFNIVIKVVNKKDLDALNRSTQKVQKSLGGLGSAAKIAAGALATIGVGKLVKGFVDVGREVESLQLRFKFLFGDAEEGAKAFDVLNEFAAKVPFSLAEISAASGNLAVVADDADELSDILGIVGNVAAVTGLDFRTTGEQIQRAFSGGIASADIFRERGVRALLGFEEGAKVSIEETRKRFFEVFGPGGAMGNATDEFAGTLDGTLSMINDSFRKFQEAVAAGFFDELKTQFGDFNTFLKENEDEIKKYGEALGEGFAIALRATGTAVKFVVDNFELFIAAGGVLIGLQLAKVIAGITAAVIALNKAMRLNPFLLLAQVAAVAGTSLYGFIAATDDAEESAENMEKAIDEQGKAVQDANQYWADHQKAIEKAKTEQEKYNDAIATTTAAYGGAYMTSVLKADKAVKDKTESVEELADATELATKQGNAFGNAYMDSVIKSNQATQEFAKNGLPQLTRALEDASDMTMQFDAMAVNAFNNFSNTLADALLTGKFNFRDFARSVLSDLARIIARQLVLLAIQKAAGFFGGPIGSFVASLAFREDGGPVKAGKPYVVGEAGPELFVPSGSGMILPNDAEFSARPGGDVTVNFNINTVDARGFESLLVEKRGVIQTIINEALNRQGKAALI